MPFPGGYRVNGEKDVHRTLTTAYSHAGTFPSRRATPGKLSKPLLLHAGSGCSCLLPAERGFGQPFCHDPGRGIMIRIVCPHGRGVGRAGVVISKTPAEPVNGLPQPACHGWELRCGSHLFISIHFRFRSPFLTLVGIGFICSSLFFFMPNYHGKNK